MPGLGIPLSLPDLPPAKRSKEAAFTAEVEINDVKSRYTLTKGETLKMITAETGADVSTRGRYFADKSLATPSDPALHLHVTAHTQEALDKGLARINELIEAAGGVDPTPAPAPQPVAPRPPPISFRDNDPWPEDKVYVTGFDPGFTVRAKIVGPGGQYVKHIQGETGTKVQVKGRGSNYIETSTGREADDDMHVYITWVDCVK